jgi:hypothetical protein
VLKSYTKCHSLRHRPPWAGSARLARLGLRLGLGLRLRLRLRLGLGLRLRLRLSARLARPASH